MAGLSGKNKKTENRQPSGKRVPFYLWLFYLGLFSLSLTGITFSRYFTTVTGTISVQVADSSVVTFLDADGTTVLSKTRVYEGQQIANVPAMDGSEAMLFSDNLDMDAGEYIYSDEDTVYRVFEGWSLDGTTVVDLDNLVIDRDMVLIAVYEILPEPPETASPSNATPSDATPSDALPSDMLPPDAMPERKPQKASPSNAS